MHPKLLLLLGLPLLLAASACDDSSESHTDATDTQLDCCDFIDEIDLDPDTQTPLPSCLDAPADSQLPRPTVIGVEDHGEYQGGVEFSVAPAADMEVRAFLDGAEIALGEQIQIEEIAGLHSLSLIAYSDTDMRCDELLFTVLDAQRGEAEWGLPAWVPESYTWTPEAELDPEWELKLLAPRQFPLGLPYPLVASLRDADKPTLATLFADFNTADFPIKRGWGYSLFELSTPGESLVTIDAAFYSSSINVAVEADPSWQEAPATIDEDTQWSGFIHLSNDLTINAGAQLTIAAGSLIAIDAKANIFVNGSLHIDGRYEAPVTLLAADPTAPWGGFVIDGPEASLTAQATLLTQGGGNEDMGHGHHRHHQPVFMASDGATLDLTSCAIFDIAGQGIGATDATVNLLDTLVANGVSGGELKRTNATIIDSAFTDFPSASLPYEDDDNDALYYSGGQNTTLLIRNSRFMFTKDDCLDVGYGQGAEMRIEDSLFDSCFHECLALSGDEASSDIHQVISNTMVTNCGQGIELGFSEPDHLVEVDHCLAYKNGVGFRYGDNYTWPKDGQMIITNSIAADNLKDTWNFDRDSWAPKPEKMTISDSLFSTEQPLYQEGNLVGSPSFDLAYQLTPESPGYQAASDGLSIGLIAPD